MTAIVANEGYLDTSLVQARLANVAEPDRVAIEIAENATTEDPMEVEFPFMRGTRGSSFVSLYRASWSVSAPAGSSITVVLRSEKGGVDRRIATLR